MTGYEKRETGKENTAGMRSVYGRKDRRGAAPMLGGASVIMVFAVLCLTIFAVLTILTVESESRISASYAASVDNYYRADTEAAAFTVSMKRLRSASKDAETFVTAAQNSGADEVTNDGSTVTIRKAFPIDNNQTLMIVLVSDGDTIRVKNWQTAFTGTWDNTSTTNLWNGIPDT